jgi:hypothetical protein
MMFAPGLELELTTSDSDEATPGAPEAPSEPSAGPPPPPAPPAEAHAEVSPQLNEEAKAVFAEPAAEPAAAKAAEAAPPDR